MIASPARSASGSPGFEDAVMATEILAFLDDIGVSELAVILLVTLLLFGGKKLPELARALGKGIRAFRQELNSVQNTLRDALNEEERRNDSSPSLPPPADKQSVEKK